MTDTIGVRRPSRWLWVALGVSLLVNAFFVGALATDLFRYSSAEKRHVSFELRWLEDRLAEPDFAVVAAAVAAARPEAERHIATLRDLRQELAVLAAAPSPDRALIEAKLVEIRTELNAMVTDSQRTAIDALLALPPSARLSLTSPTSGDD
ncbi:MAG: periplasmic heavy metal sensor [Bauldia sp.]|nr:periplasmic heavy metal sensor [Bauldia sp.]